LKPVETGALRVVRPLLIVLDKTGQFAGSFTSTIARIPYNSEEVRVLRMEVAALRADLAYKEDLERENILLRSMAGRGAEEESYVLARVIGRSFNGLDDSIVLDIGSAEGIETGFPVLAEGAIHIGFVEEVTHNSARVRLFSRIGERQEVYLPESSVSSVAEGEGLGVITLHVPDSIAITKGEPVFSAGQRDYFLGFVEAVSRVESGPFQIIKMGLPFSVRDVRDVFVILN